MEALAHKLNEAMGAKATIATTTDLHASLDGADFVIVCISTGGFRSMAVDLDVPATHGITQTVGDTVGPGRHQPRPAQHPRPRRHRQGDGGALPGRLALQHHQPHDGVDPLGVPRDQHQDGRPLPRGRQLLHGPGHRPGPARSRRSRPRSPASTTSRCSPRSRSTAPTASTCCAAWSTRSAAWPRWPRTRGAPRPTTFSKLDFAERHLFKLTLLERWGTFPAAGDRHIAEFVSFALTPESEWGAAYNIELSPIARREQHQADYIADVDAWLAGTKDLQTWQSGELPSPMIQAMLTGEPFEAPVNIPNTGQAVGLPADAVIESICVIDGDGIRGRDRSALPTPYDEIVRRHVATQELTVEAALRGDRTLAGEAFALDPLAGRGDLHVTDAMVDELLSGTAEWLPQFASR